MCVPSYLCAHVRMPLHFHAWTYGAVFTRMYIFDCLGIYCMYAAALVRGCLDTHVCMLLPLRHVCAIACCSCMFLAVHVSSCLHSHACMLLLSHACCLDMHVCMAAVFTRMYVCGCLYMHVCMWFPFTRWASSTLMYVCCCLHRHVIHSFCTDVCYVLFVRLRFNSCWLVLLCLSVRML